MSTSKHTPGPLGSAPMQVYYSADTVSVHSLEPYKENASGRNRVMGPLPKTPENIARCCTFAAAPELLWALEQVLISVGHGDAKEIARAALAKVKP